MKFLCRNCKAKYQIADEKVAGRTLRMSCQQCGEQIVVRGPGGRAGGVSRPISQPLAASLVGSGVGPGVPPAPSALGVDFQRQVVAAGYETASARGADEWHVAINDVPVGPMRREEVARKISAGAVSRESLAWREGMDDWMPAKHIPELAVLFAPAPGALGPRLSAPPAPAVMPVPPPAPVQPAARTEMAPIGGRQVLTLDDYAPPQELMTQAIVSQVAEPASASKPFGPAQMFALVAGGAFLILIGAVAAKFLLLPQQQQQQAAVIAAPVAAPAPVAPAAPVERTGQGVDAQGNVIQLGTQAIDGQSAAAAARRPSGGTSAGDKNKTPPAKQLTDEQKAMLARMGGGLDQGAGPNLKAPSEAQHASSSGGGTGQLTAEQLGGVVLRGKKNLQRCYETALRGANSDETVRLDVDLEVSPSGNVTSVHTTGKGLPGMDECITRTVRMWRFPSSGDGAQTRFPVVFQPGA